MPRRAMSRYLMCPQCDSKRVTFREFSDGDGYACDRCKWSIYRDEPGDRVQLNHLVIANPGLDPT